jgi:hypothetical protein
MYGGFQKPPMDDRRDNGSYLHQKITESPINMLACFWSVKSNKLLVLREIKAITLAEKAVQSKLIQNDANTVLAKIPCQIQRRIDNT